MSSVQVESINPAGPALRRIAVPWICYLAYFVGVSFQSGGIVHYSLDPSKYGTLVAIGAVIFVAGAIGSDLLAPKPILRSTGPLGFLAFVVSVLTLSIGVGMIGGGVQHFSDIPDRAPILIPLGIVLSILGYCGRFRPQHHAKEVFASLAAVGLLAIPTYVALKSHAASLQPATASSHGHDDSHADSDATTPTTPPLTLNAPAVTLATPIEPVPAVAATPAVSQTEPQLTVTSANPVAPPTTIGAHDADGHAH